jgi:hypothetical protein
MLTHVKPPRKTPQARKTDRAAETIASFARPPHWIEPCIPTLVAKPPKGDRSRHQVKWDGYLIIGGPWRRFSPRPANHPACPRGRLGSLVSSSPGEALPMVSGAATKETAIAAGRDMGTAQRARRARPDGLFPVNDPSVLRTIATLR